MSGVDAIPPGSPGAIPPAPQPPRREAKATLDQSDFLTLMTAQLKNQDPTKPVDNQQYVQQMAMFSQLAGTTETNAKLAEITKRLDQLVAAATPAQE